MPGINILYLARQPGKELTQGKATVIGASTLVGEKLLKQILTHNVESCWLDPGKCQWCNIFPMLPSTNP
jgi:5,10-methylene-tetrahydrofolate dehydrogenase/methenyl tetrahydrofolate cyclohydrolase